MTDERVFIGDQRNQLRSEVAGAGAGLLGEPAEAAGRLQTDAWAAVTQPLHKRFGRGFGQFGLAVSEGPQGVFAQDGGGGLGDEERVGGRLLQLLEGEQRGDAHRQRLGRRRELL